MDAYPHGWIGSCPVIVGMYHHIHVLSREQPFFSRWAFDDMRRYDIAACRKIPLRDGPKGQPPFQLKSVRSADRRPATAPVLSPRTPGRAVPALTKTSPKVLGGRKRSLAGGLFRRSVRNQSLSTFSGDKNPPARSFKTPTGFGGEEVWILDARFGGGQCEGGAPPFWPKRLPYETQACSPARYGMHIRERKG